MVNHRWITYHGVALHVCPDLRPFQAIVPCGISNSGVASVALLSEDTSRAGTSNAQQVEDGSCTELLQEYRFALLEAFADVFGLQLQQGDVQRWFAQGS